MTKAFCTPKCGTVAIPMPPYPPFWGGGGGALPPDPNVLAISCPTVPATAVCGAADLTITVNGQAFTANTDVLLDGNVLATTFVSATQLKATVQPSLEAAARTGTITVTDGGTVGSGACPFTFTAAPKLTVTCPLVPISAMCGSPNISVDVKGTNFTATSQVRVDGVPVATTFVSPTLIRFQAQASTELTPKTITVGAQEGAVVATATCPFNFTQAVLVPTITDVWPDMIGRSNPGVLVTITGTNFDATSTVMRGVQALPTTFVSATELTILSNAVTATTGSFDVRVRNGTSGAYQLSPTFVQASCALNPTCNLLVPNTAPAGSAQLEVKFLGNNLGNTAEVLVDGLPVPSTWVSGGDVRFDVDPSTLTAGTVLQVSVRLGHDHTQGHDNVLPAVAPLSLPFTIS